MPVKKQHTIYNMPVIWNIFLLGCRQPAHKDQIDAAPPMIKAMVLKALALFHLLSMTVASS
jgi:hypothetical protein